MEETKLNKEKIEIELFSINNEINKIREEMKTCEELNKNIEYTEILSNLEGKIKINRKLKAKF
jgi:hypothetical protein